MKDRPRYYTLIGHEAVPCDLMTWAHWFERADRIVAQDQIGPLHVSTVFLGLDHNWFGDEPHLFETMLFDACSDSYQNRCATWVQAEAMHAEGVAVARAKIEAADQALGEMGSILGRFRQ